MRSTLPRAAASRKEISTHAAGCPPLAAAEPTSTDPAGTAATPTTELDGVLIEILSFDGCPNREPAVELVERIVRETGVTARIEVVDVTDEETARARRFLGSPTILIAGHDVEPGAEARCDYSVSCRVYRADDGLRGLPDAQWLRDALA